MQVGNVCDMVGYCWGVQPGKVLDPLHVVMWLSGFQASCTPRMGDHAASSQILGSTSRAGVDHLGCANLFRGASDIGTCRVVDCGYVHLDRNTAAANARLGNPSLQDWCRQVTSSR